MNEEFWQRKIERITALKARRDAAKRNGCNTVYIYCVYAICEMSAQVRRRQKTLSG